MKIVSKIVGCILAILLVGELMQEDCVQVKVISTAGQRSRKVVIPAVVKDVVVLEIRVLVCK